MSSKYKYTHENYPTFRNGDHALKYTLRVTLKHVTPNEVPSNITLRHLADLILSLMGWSGGHLNEIFDFLMAEGYYSFDKVVLLEFLGFYANEHPEHLALIKSLLRHLLECYAKDLPKCRICDGNVAAFAVGMVVDCGFEDLIPQVKAIYDTGYVDCSVEGPYEEVVKNIGLGLGRGFDIKSTAPRDIVANCRKQFT